MYLTIVMEGFARFKHFHPYFKVFLDLCECFLSCRQKTINADNAIDKMVDLVQGIGLHQGITKGRIVIV